MIPRVAREARSIGFMIADVRAPRSNRQFGLVRGDDASTMAVLLHSWAHGEDMSSHCFCFTYRAFSQVELTVS